MELKPGYKQTEVGVIPADWEVKPLGAIGRVIRGSSPRPKADKRFYGGSVPRLMVEDVTRDRKFVTPSIDFLTVEGAKRSRPCKRGTLTVVCSGTPTVVGLPSLLDIDACIHDGMLALVHMDRSVDPEYLFYRLTSLQENLHAAATHGGTFVNLTTTGFRAFTIALPTTLEQRTIAGALGDVDALLVAMEKLIVKKRDLKQAVMQQLLTGQTRLPGFTGEWEMKRLCSVLRFQVGFPFSSAFFNEEGQGIRLVKNRDLKSDDQVFCYSGKYDSAFLVSNGDVLVGMDGDFLPCLWAKGLALLNQRVGRIVPLAGLDRVFAFYYLIKPLKEIEIATSSTTVKHLSHGDIEDIEKPLPCVAEQTAIAEVLSDMDAELAALEQRLAKTHALKQGMMQELLTGRVRLI